jgi:dTMP kinase
MLKNTNKGKFIVFEGLDGSGQSTQAGLLRDFLLEKGYEVVLTKEPTIESEAGRKIRKVLDKKLNLNPKELQELFAQDRKEHLENTIIPALKQGKIVISDRYFFSSFAFGTVDNLDLEWLIEINNSFLFPDISFLLKVKPETCIERIEGRGLTKTLFEKKEKLEKTWETYKVLPGRFENVYLINGERSIDEIFKEIKEILSNKLNV